MKKLLIISLIIIFSCSCIGCSGRLYQWELKKMGEFCNDKGGVDHIEVDVFINPKVRCVNGDFTYIKNRN
ncbi:hypothetical protein M0R04_04980 [Candidatus Dojkabacteria bacterium]|jgi:hypothetical protein|nr:hypothetical protein [Candidatus Dojkabacteria bacterium]